MLPLPPLPPASQEQLPPSQPELPTLLPLHLPHRIRAGSRRRSFNFNRRRAGLNRRHSLRRRSSFRRRLFCNRSFRDRRSFCSRGRCRRRTCSLSRPGSMTTARSRPTAFTTVTRRCAGDWIRNSSFENSSSLPGILASCFTSSIVDELAVHNAQLERELGILRHPSRYSLGQNHRDRRSCKLLS